MYPFNICSSVLARFSLREVIDIVTTSGLKGIELKVHPEGHKSIDEIERQGVFLRKQFEHAGLDVPVLSSYVAAEDFESVDRLIDCSHQLGAQKIRLVLPKTSGNSAYLQADPNVMIPSYELDLHPIKTLSRLKTILEKLEKKAYRAGTSFLFELHWGTIMSSFSAAYWLLKDFDPNCMAVTFDPANMVIEGKEDWEYGVSLLSPYIQNVHVKNMVWGLNHAKAFWNWSPIQVGYLNWSEIIGVLTKNGYEGDYAIEDFLLNTKDKGQTKLMLQESLNDFMEYYEYFGPPSKQYVWKTSAIPIHLG
jgi:sugar phosphate isomerase/epimerase